MKRISLIVLTSCLSVTLAYAQKPKVQTAWNFYKEPYQQYDKAKEAIDEASVHESTSGMAKTWYYKGLIYAALYNSEKYKGLCDNCLWVAYESFAKANQLDPKNDWADEITTVRIPLVVNDVFKNGVKAYESKDFKTALVEFEKVLIMSPGDTSVILNSAYSAEHAGDMTKAKQYYNQLISYKFNDDKIFLSLSEIYMKEKDTVNALKTIREGRAAYPDSLGLMLNEINILLSSGKQKEATAALDAAIAHDSKNPSLYLALGATFDNLANPRDKAAKEALKPEQYTDYISKAEKAYKDGIAIDPSNYVLNYNLGALYFNQAVEMINAANLIKSNVEFDKAKAKYELKFKEAQPYLEKSLETNPNKSADDKDTYKGTLTSLKQLYIRTGETEKYTKVSDQLKTLE